MHIARPPRRCAFRVFFLGQFLMVGAVPTQTLGLKLLYPFCDDGAYWLHSELIKPTAKKPLQLINVTDVEGVRLFGSDLHIPCELFIFVVITHDMSDVP